MRVPATAAALRVARALLNITQRVAAERANIMQKSVSAAESGKVVLLETNLALVDYYRSAGIVFLGSGQIGEEVEQAGAMWSGPEGPTEVPSTDAVFRVESMDVCFRAARALMGKEQADVAQLADVTADVVKNLEKGVEGNKSYATLRSWYEDQGVEFTGWGDIASRRFFRVGVRWRK